MSFLYDLIEIADVLDYNGHTVEAAEIDEAMQKGPIAGAAGRFADALKKELWESNLEREAMSKVFAIIDNLVARGGFFVPSVESPKKDKVVDMVWALAEYENSVMELTQELAVASDEEDRRILEIELKDDKNRLKNLYADTEEMLRQFQSGKRVEDQEDYNRFFETYLQHTGRKYRPQDV